MAQYSLIVQLTLKQQIIKEDFSNVYKNYYYNYYNFTIDLSILYIDLFIYFRKRPLT